MAQISKDNEMNVKMMLLGGLFLVALASVLSWAGFWILSATHSAYQETLALESPLLVQNTGAAFYYGSPLILLGLFVFGMHGIWVGLRKSRNHALARKIGKIFSILAVAGLICVFAGRLVGDWYWSELFQNAGYSECSGSFNITKKWSRSVWARDKSFCTDSEVRRMFASYEYDLLDINAYLKADER